MMLIDLVQIQSYSFKFVGNLLYSNNYCSRRVCFFCRMSTTLVALPTGEMEQNSGVPVELLKVWKALEAGVWREVQIFSM